MKTLIAACSLMALIVGLSIWYEVTLWHECRVAFSWFYCVRVLGR